MLKVVSEDMHEGEIAALYQQGENAVILINTHVTDPEIRADAVTRLLERSSPALTL